MSLQNQIENEMKDSFVNNRKETSLLKYIVSEFQRRPNLNKELTDSEVISLIKKYIKGIEETVKITNTYTDEQKFEVDFLQKYLPKMASEDEIRNWIIENIELSENKQARMKSMGVIMKHFGSSADGNTVRNILMSL